LNDIKKRGRKKRITVTQKRRRTYLVVSQEEKVGQPLGGGMRLGTKKRCHGVPNRENPWLREPGGVAKTYSPWGGENGSEQRFIVLGDRKKVNIELPLNS